MRVSILLGILILLLACTLGQTPPQTPPEPAPVSQTESNPQPLPSGDVIRPEDIVYLGAFRLPGGDERPQTFAYGGNAMTFNPDHGTLFIMGHDRIAYGELPDGNQIAEISIPEPILSRNIEDLNTAEFVQEFQNVMETHFLEYDEIPKVGMQYLNRPETGSMIHIAFGEHLQGEQIPTHGWINSTLSDPDFQGEWFIGNQDLYSVNGYLFEIPASWADAYTAGRYLATGRMRDGGQGGMGPALFAYRPWLDDGSPAPSGTRLEETPLLLYENATNTEDIVRSLNGYQHPDEWSGGAWLTTSSGNQAVLFAGTKSNGEKYWYGYITTRTVRNSFV